MKKKILKRSNYKGAYLIEVIIALFLLSAGILTIMSLLASTMRTSQNDRNLVIATMLAQEGTELVRNIRDNNWAARRGTFEVGFPTNDSGNCRIDAIINASMPASCSYSFTDQTLYPNAQKFYVHSGSGTSTFHRKISIDYDGVNNSTNANYVTVTSYVVWGKAAFPATCNATNNCVSSQVILTKWGS